MTSDPPETPQRNPLLTLAALVVIVWGLQVLRPALLPICFSLFLAVLGSLPLHWLTRRGVPSRLAAVLVVALLAGLLWLLILGLQEALAGFAAAVPTYRTRVEGLLADAVGWLSSVGIEADPKQVVASLEPRAWMNFLGQSVGGALGLVSSLLLVLFGLGFLLFEVDAIRGRLRRHLGEAYDEDKLGGLVDDLQRYIGVKTLTSVLTGAIVFSANSLFGVGFPLLWGLIALVLNFVPIIGSIIAAVPAVLLALVDPELGVRIAVPLAIVYLLVNNGISNLLEPILMGQRIGMSPFAVLLSLVFWGWLWGPGGMFLAVPLTLVAGVLLAGNRDLRFLAALIGRR